MSTSEQFDKDLHAFLVGLAKEGVYNAARGISDMVGEELSVSAPDVRQVPLSEIPDLLGGPEVEVVGIYLRAYGEIPSQILMVVNYQKALELVDLMMGLPVGTTQELGQLERSALAELGNLTGSFFLNAIASLTKTDTRPSPPAVVVDMVGAMVDIILTTFDGLSDSVPMIQSKFYRKGREIQANFWVVPERNALETIIGRSRA